MAYKRVNVNFDLDKLQEFQELLKKNGVTSFSGYIRYLVDKDMKLLKEKLNKNSY